jgi:hypothetical protein
LIQALIEEGSEKRAQLLDQFISQHLQAYLAAVPSNQFQAADKAELARGFGKLLAKITSDMLSYERAHKVETNWNGPEEEQEVCRLTSQMGRDYYLAPEATRRGVASKYVDMFSGLPMPLEELAFGGGGGSRKGLERGHAKRRTPRLDQDLEERPPH